MRAERSDADLLAATKEEPNAFAVFYDRYERAILGYLVRRTRNAELAADLTAEAFAAALSSAHTYRPESPTAAAWVFTIAQNTLARSLRRGRVEARARHRLGIRDAFELDLGQIERIEAMLDADQWVGELLESLPHDQQEAVRARNSGRDAVRGDRAAATDLRARRPKARQPGPGDPARAIGETHMTLLPQVREQLDAAAHRKVRRRPLQGPMRMLGWPRAIGRTVPVALSVATALAIAVIAITALHAAHRGGSRPANQRPVQRASRVPRLVHPPSPAQRAIDAVVGEATVQTIHSDQACQNANRGATIVHGSPGQQLLSRLGVLRRPAIPSSTLRTLLAAGFTAGSRVDIDYIRLAQIAYGNAYYLIPEGNPSGREPMPARCYSEMRTHLKQLTAHLPAAERTAALQQQSQNLQGMRQQVAQAALCFAIVTTRHVRPPNGVNSGCSSTTSFLHPGWQGIGQGDPVGGQIFAAIVPDGVATVTLKFSAGSDDPGRILIAHAINNVVAFKIPPHTAHADFPSAFIWRSADGRIVNRSG